MYPFCQTLNKPFWQNIINLCQMVEGLFSVWQSFEPTLQACYHMGQPFNDVNGQITHLVTLHLSHFQVIFRNVTTVLSLPSGNGKALATSS